MSSLRHVNGISAIVGGLLVVWAVFLGIAATDALAVFQQTEDHGNSGTGCHCGEDYCGCAPPRAGCTLPVARRSRRFRAETAA